MKKKINKVVFTVLRKGEVVDYQTIIEEKIGMEISKLSCYDANYDMKREINGERVDRDRAYFVADDDYELIVRKKRKPKNNK